MDGITTLRDKAELFSASSRLSSTAEGLNELIDGKQISEPNEDFEFTAALVGQVDWDSKHYHQREHPELCVTATKLRPKFYETLLRYGVQVHPKFFEELYETLKSYGRNVKLRRRELIQVYQVFQTMASDILTALDQSQRIG